MSERLVICIGAQKAGTTWLADYMRAHPQVHSPPVKEVHYFDARFAPQWCAKYEAEMLAEFQREVAALSPATCGDPARQAKLSAMLLRFRMIADPREYLRFMRWGAAGRPVLFEATPDYSMLPEEGFRAMRAMHPDVRLIFLLRNPADRFLSSMRFNRTHIPEFDIEGAFSRLLAREDFRLLADYGRTIRAALSVFDKERLHVEFYETLFNPAAVARFCAFAGIDPAPADFAARSNPSAPNDDIARRRNEARDANAHVYRDIAALFPDGLPESWRGDIAALTSTAGAAS
jgi:hypothetical protein